jgi:hypothetical protein
MKSIHRQRGMTPIGWILILLLIAFFALIALKLVPIYIESFTVGSVISDLKNEPGIGSKTTREITSIVNKRFDINTITNVSVDDIYIEKLGGTMTISAEYEVRKPMLGNVDIVVSFNKKVEVDAR